MQREIGELERAARLALTEHGAAREAAAAAQMDLQAQLEAANARLEQLGREMTDGGAQAGGERLTLLDELDGRVQRARREVCRIGGVRREERRIWSGCYLLLTARMVLSLVNREPRIGCAIHSTL